jgi:hypothetical protein
MENITERSGQMVDPLGNGLAVQRGFANVAQSQTDQSLVAAVAGFKIRVLSFIVMAGGTATTGQFNSKSANPGTAISQNFQCAANGGVCGNHNRHGWFETNAGEGLSFTTGAGSTVGVQFTYVLVLP